MVAQDRRPRRNGAQRHACHDGKYSLAARIAANDAEPEPIWGAAEWTDILNEAGARLISRSQVCRLVTNGDLPKRRQVGKAAYSKRAIRVQVARITVDGSMIQPDARACATWVIGGTGNLGGNS